MHLIILGIVLGIVGTLAVQKYRATLKAELDKTEEAAAEELSKKL